MKIEYIDEDDIVIEILVDDEALVIKKVKLFKFIRDNELNAWVLDFYDPHESDRHGQETGEYSIEEYFTLDFDSKIKNDIMKFLKEKTK